MQLCFMSDSLLFLDLFSCIAANLFNKLTYLLKLVIVTYSTLKLKHLVCVVIVVSLKFYCGNLEL